MEIQGFWIIFLMHLEFSFWNIFTFLWYIWPFVVYYLLLYGIVLHVFPKKLITLTSSCIYERKEWDIQFCWKPVHVFNIVFTTKFITLLTFELFQLDKYINKKGNADRFSESELTPVFMMDGVHLNMFPTLVLHFNVPLDEYLFWHLNSLFKVKISNWIIQAFLLNNVLQHFNPQMLNLLRTNILV